MRIPYKKAIGQDLKPGRPSIGKKPGKPELKKLYIKETRSIREIAENLRCSKDMVYRALQEYGIEIRGKTRDSKLSSIDFALLKKKSKRITQNKYDEKYQEFRTSQKEIKSKIDNLDKADNKYYMTASYILSLVNRAYDLFLSSEPMIKRQLLKLLLQNCEIENASLRYTLNYPFSEIFSYTKRHKWLLG